MHQAIHEATSAVANREELSVVRRRLHGMVYARALEKLGRVGLGAGDVSVSYLAPDLVTAVQWGLRPELTRWLSRGRRCRNPCDAESHFDHRRVAVFLERHSAFARTVSRPMEHHEPNSHTKGSGSDVQSRHW